MASFKDSFELHLENVYNAQTAQESANAAKAASAGGEGGLLEKVGAGAAAGGAGGLVEGVVKPAARGVIQGAANTLRTGEWLARDLFGVGKNQPSVGEFISNQVAADQEAQGGQNVGQDLIQGVAQFFTGLKGAKGVGQVMSKVPGASKVGEMATKAMGKFPARAQTLMGDMAAGTGASALAFDPTEERLGLTAVTGLADLAGVDPKIANTLKAYLLGSKDDPEALARVKALVGDAFTGVVASPAFRQGTKMGGKAIKAVSDWMGNMAQQERSAMPPAPAPTAPPNPQAQSVARDFQTMREAPDMPRTPLHPATLELAEQRALTSEANPSALIKDIEDQLATVEMNGVELEFKPSNSLLPELNSLAPNGHTWATILDALHQKFGYEANGISDPLQAWGTHGWMFSAESVGAYTQHVRGQQIAKPISGGSMGAATVEEAAGPLAHEGGRPVTMPESRIAQQPEQGSGLVDALAGIGERLTGMKPDQIEAEINKLLGVQSEAPVVAPKAQPATRVFEDVTFDGKRMAALIGPNENMVVIQKDGKDAGFLWYERQEGGGFKTKKIEVKPEFRRQGLASQLQDEVEKVEGSYKGAATDLTPEGKAYQEGRQAKKSAQATAGYQPEVEGILGVPETAREGVQQAIQQKAQQMGLGPVDLQNVILAIEALKEK